MGFNSVFKGLMVIYSSTVCTLYYRCNLNVCNLEILEMNSYSRFCWTVVYLKTIGM